MLLKNKVAVIYGAGGAIGGAVAGGAIGGVVARALRATGPRFFSPGTSERPSKLLPRISFPPEDPPRQRGSTRSTSRPSTSICSP